MSQIQYVDELIREYLLYRGFSGTLKMFDTELKSDKEKGFRVSMFNVGLIVVLVQYLIDLMILRLLKLVLGLPYRF